MQKVLAAFDKCKDSLTAGESCEIAKDIFEEVSFVVDTVPLSDGGEGFVEILTQQASGELIFVKASDALGKVKDVSVGLCELENLPAATKEFLNLTLTQGKIAIIEMASVVGLADLPFEERNAWKTSTLGMGEVLAHCASLELDAILIGIGGSATNDMGLGSLVGLGLELQRENGEIIDFPCPKEWHDLAKIKLNHLLDLPPLKIACDVRNPLLGPNGATHQYGKQKGLNQESRERLESKMEEMVTKLSSHFSKAEENSILDGSGAAGGIGYGLGLAYDVSLVPGFDLIRIWFDLDNKIKDCDFVFTGEGRFDKTSLQGKGPFEVIRLANIHSKKSFLIAGSVDSQVKEDCQNQFSDLQIHSFSDPELSLEENLKKGGELMAKKLKNVFFDNENQD
jgi:glycerate kinase